METSKPSPFLQPRPKTAPNDLAIISLSKDHFQQVTLRQSAGAIDGYAEGITLNTRFGSFPHSTLLDIPWGSQVRASNVDTGSRGRKRRRGEAEGEGTPSSLADDENDSPAPAAAAAAAAAAPVKQATTAASGFIYVLRPTPELWTSSLPHRTQVVYTPDYSYILQRIRARPGTRIIEAGAGSGSFTHASARAVYDGYPAPSESASRGKVFSFEFHEPRYQKMQEEIRDHGLEGIVHISHRDVYQDGFLIDGQSPKVSAIFLDLPAPWRALHHLSRRKTLRGGSLDKGHEGWTSPLDPEQSVYICTFSPCIEQVTRTVTELRTLGWTDIDMVEIAHKRFNVMRDRAGPSTAPANVAQAMEKLKGDLKRTQEFHKAQKAAAANEMDVDGAPLSAECRDGGRSEAPAWSKGQIVHRPENEFKTHTSYLVFAILPREWDEAAEAAAAAKWPCGKESKTIGNVDKETRKQEKREALASKKNKKQKQEDTQKAE